MEFVWIILLLGLVGHSIMIHEKVKVQEETTELLTDWLRELTSHVEQMSIQNNKNFEVIAKCLAPEFQENEDSGKTSKDKVIN